MKRKLAVFSLFVILMAVFVATIRNAGRRSTGVTQSLIATQDGSMTVLQQPDQYATTLLIVDRPTPSSASNGFPLRQVQPSLGSKTNL